MFFLLLSCLISISLSVDPQIYTYKTVDGLDIQAGVYVPEITPDDKFPVMLIIHGGGLLAGDLLKNAMSTQELDEMLSRGWVVVAIDYRLGPYTFLPAIVEDIVDAYNWIRNDLVNSIPININAIAILGNSAGASLAAIAGYKVTPPPQAIVAFYPYCTDFTGSFAYNSSTAVSAELEALANAVRQPRTKVTSQEDSDATWALFFKMQEEQKASWVLTTSNANESSDTILTTMKEYSVVYNIDANYPATYLIHGLADTLVPTTQSTQMADVLKSQNVTYQLDLVPGVEHAFNLVTVSDELWQQHLIPVFDFVETYIGKATGTPISTSAGMSKLIIIGIAVIALAIVMMSVYLIIFIKKQKSNLVNPVNPVNLNKMDVIVIP